VPKTLQQPIIKRIIQPTINLPANATDRSRPEANQFRNQELEYEVERFRNIQLREERLRKQSDDFPVAESDFATPVKAISLADPLTQETRDRISKLNQEAMGEPRGNFPTSEVKGQRAIEILLSKLAKDNKKKD